MSLLVYVLIAIVVVALVLWTMTLLLWAASLKLRKTKTKKVVAQQQNLPEPSKVSETYYMTGGGIKAHLYSDCVHLLGANRKSKKYPVETTKNTRGKKLCSDCVDRKALEGK